jgi:hypothetical protein
MNLSLANLVKQAGNEYQSPYKQHISSLIRVLEEQK